MKQDVVVLLFEQALSLDFSGPVEVLEAATRLLDAQGRGNKGYTLRYAGLQTGPVRLSCGLRVHADITPEDAAGCGMLLIPGGFGVDSLCKDKVALSRLTTLAHSAGRVVSVCNGAFILAQTGLLQGRQATTHWYMAEDFAAQHPAVRLHTQALYVQDGHIYTSAGVTAGIDLALSLVEADFGHALAMQVARMLVLYLRRPGTQQQFSDPLEAQGNAGTRFRHVYEWAQAHLQHALTVEELADVAGMSPRNFARVFTRTTGRTPAKFVEELRLMRARELLEAGESNLDHVAERAGFGREERLRRAFARSLGISPKQYLSHFAAKERSS
ncbi:GlxA family transcriptional regulator [Desulfovibrio mangrovi]|uniref:GlxA family transcriptional regulator n=1 Tax=Desulfovibrio mangrovi TaxID=2976983 RepID=UPI002245DE5E|nr:GlxA family transcriptional regulator [Desulfovibrio mangrovi]UZP66472.1 GlxA family transcriptional regulator [Desulfovibrio mangrovi]